MNEMVYPLARESVQICTFPGAAAEKLFLRARYTRVICNSRYTASGSNGNGDSGPTGCSIRPWIWRRKAGRAEREHHPLRGPLRAEGFKRQREMLSAFLRLRRVRPEASVGWKLILAGGSNPATPICRIERAGGLGFAGSVELKTTSRRTSCGRCTGRPRSSAYVRTEAGRPRPDGSILE
jgi:hypothetical protein